MTTPQPIVPLDSPKGMQMLVDWAKAHEAVLGPQHAKLAQKHGVSLEGVMLSRPLPR